MRKPHRLTPGYALRRMRALGLRPHGPFVTVLAFGNCCANPYTGAGPRRKPLNRYQ